MYKIRKVEFLNHPVLGNLCLDFCDCNNKAVDTVIFAGINGVGKSCILNELYNIDVSLFMLLTVPVRRYNLKPIAVWILNEVYPHVVILVTDTANLVMQFMSSVKVVNVKCQMKFLLAYVILLRMRREPCQLKLKLRCVVADIDDYERAVSGSLAASLGQAECLLVKRKRFI